MFVGRGEEIGKCPYQNCGLFRRTYSGTGRIAVDVSDKAGNHLHVVALNLLQKNTLIQA